MHFCFTEWDITQFLLLVICMLYFHSTLFRSRTNNIKPSHSTILPRARPSHISFSMILIDCVAFALSFVSINPGVLYIRRKSPPKDRPRLLHNAPSWTRIIDHFKYGLWHVAKLSSTLFIEPNEKFLRCVS